MPRYNGPPELAEIEQELRAVRRRARERDVLDDGPTGRIEVWEVTADDDGEPERVGDTPALTVALGGGGATDE